MRRKSWYRQDRRAPFVIVSTVVVVIVLLMTMRARGAECPPGVTRCKVLVITPDMEQVLVGQNMILDTAEWGNRINLGPAVQFFKKAIEAAPAGEVKPDEPKK